MAVRMTLEVQQSVERSAQVTVPAGATVRELKDAVFRVTGIAPKLQILAFELRELRDDAVLRDCGVGDGDIISLEERYDDSVNSIRVVVSDGASLTRSLRVQKGIAVEALTSEVQKMYPPHTSVMLALHGDMLEEGKSFADYGVVEGETVELKVVANVLGGVSTSNSL